MILISFLYLLTRLFFLRNYPVFYDSFEYSKIAQIINFSNFAWVINSSHQPIHTFYFLTILFLKDVFFFLPSDIILSLTSFLFGFLTILFWYLFVKEYLGKKKAFFASLLVLLFPYFFLANTNILYESELLFFQIASLYFFYKAVKHYKNAVYLQSDSATFALLAGLLFGLSVSIFTGSLLILPIFLLLLWQKRTSKNLLPFASLILLVFLVPLLIDFAILKSLQTILAKYQPHFGDFVSSQEGPLVFIYRLLRNIALESMAILSPAGAIVLALTVVIFLLTTHYPLLTTFFWFLPPLVLMQFWHSGLFGRLSLFLIFPASLILAKTIVKPWQKILVLFPLFVLLIPKFFIQTQRPPIYRYYNLIKDNPNLVILTSDSNCFLYQKNNLPAFVFNPGNDLPEAEKFIKENLRAGKTVLIDSAGLNYPYFQFDGDFYHPLSKNPKSPPHLEPLLKKFKTEIYKSDPKRKEIYFERIDLSSTN